MKVEGREMGEVKDKALPHSAHARRKCPECNGERFIRDYESAEIVCISCGYVIADRIEDAGPEWRAFDDDQREKRTRRRAFDIYNPR